MTGALIDRLQPVIAYNESKAAALAWERLRTDDGDASHRLQEFLADHGEAYRILDAIFAASPFLTDQILREPDEALACLCDSPQRRAEALLAEATAALALETEAEFKRTLRRIKAKSALLIALADIAGAWPVETVTEVLTGFADASLKVSVDWLL